MNHFSSNEIISGNPLHLILLLTSVGLLLWKPKEGIRRRGALLYATGVVASFVLFCALLRWQMWSSRYHLPLFVLGAALIGLALERYSPRPLANTIATILLLFAVFFALTNRSRSLIPWSRVDDVYRSRAEQYFTNEHESIAPANIAAAQFVSRLECRNLAIDSYVADPEIKNSPDSFFIYPLLALIRANGTNRSVSYTGVGNLSTRYQNQQAHSVPCAVICLDCTDHPEKWSEYKDVGNPSVFGNIVIFGHAGEAPRASALNQ
jgi:branched-subunit amino acid ABC-type transport system permease component